MIIDSKENIYNRLPVMAGDKCIEWWWEILFVYRVSDKAVVKSRRGGSHIVLRIILRILTLQSFP